MRRDETKAHRRAEGRSDGRVKEPLERVVPATGQGERDGKGGRFGYQGWRQRAGMGGDGGGGGRKEAAAEAAGGAPPPPHRSAPLWLSFLCVCLAGLGFLHFVMPCWSILCFGAHRTLSTRPVSFGLARLSHLSLDPPPQRVLLSTYLCLTVETAFFKHISYSSEQFCLCLSIEKNYNLFYYDLC
jgi:hypothetical protein